MVPEDIALTRALVTALGALVLAACSLPEPYRPPAASSEAVPSRPAVPPPTAAAPPAAAVPAEAPPAPAPPTREYRLGPATQSLVAQARAQTARGELPGASTTLDRALRIEPQNPLLWIEVARLRLAENDARQAEAFARKALALSSGDRSARAQAGRVLADALRAQRRNQEARELEAEPWMH
jgi:tetratricopeptide (TPR) repeat protein